MKKIFKVLYAGYSLKNPEVWKTRQLLLNAIAAFIGALVLLLPPEYDITSADLNIIAEFVAFVAFSVYNAYFTIATTDKIGLPVPIEVTTESVQPTGTNGFLDQINPNSKSGR